jgi:hypothetical protein
LKILSLQGVWFVGVAVWFVVCAFGFCLVARKKETWLPSLNSTGTYPYHPVTLIFSPFSLLHLFLISPFLFPSLVVD